MLKLLICCTILLFSFTGVSSNEDEIKSLPGLSRAPPFKQYSGYLKGLNDNQLHYWFIESRQQPSKAPVVLWLNGGPGCSSLIGLLTENGPFGIEADGKHLHYRNSSWNDFANVIFLEAPAGVGFSYNKKRNYTWNDDTVADNNHAALKSFFKKYPQYAKNDFYITGESYAGIYIPTLIVRLLNDTKINLKAFAVGNGLSDTRLNDNSQIYYAYYHGIFGDKIWSKLLKYCCPSGMCNFHDSTDSQCNKTLAAAKQVMNNDLNNYDIYADCDGCSSPQSLSSEAAQLLKLLHPELSTLHGQNLPKNQLSPDIIYLNRKDVRQALHIPSDLPQWGECSGNINYTIVYNSAIKLYPKLLKKYRALVYNGDVDMVCNFLGDQWAVRSLHRKVTKPRQPWFYNDSNGKQIGGYVIRYDKMDFLTVRGAGHQVPTYRPRQAYQMIYNFIHNKPYSTHVVP